MEVVGMFKSPSRLPEDARTKIADALNQRLADGIDLQTQLKVAHWNLKGPQFAAIHPLLDTIASSVAEHNDDIAERAVTLGARAYGTARHVAKSSKLAEYPQETIRDLDHVRLSAERIETYLEGVRDARTLSGKLGDDDTVDLLTVVARDLEKHAWFLRATLEG
jgi:starvation-inducible DNA-binding protein